MSHVDVESAPSVASRVLGAAVVVVGLGSIAATVATWLELRSVGPSPSFAARFVMDAGDFVGRTLFGAPPPPSQLAIVVTVLLLLFVLVGLTLTALGARVVVGGADASRRD
ncbi:MAG: hypothetical protein R3F34_11035 [Planctomycetota bacterium]